MYTVTRAKVVGTKEQNGQQLAQVEVQVAERADRLTAYVHPDSNGSYTISQVLTDEADYELDWFDNDLHQAFSDISDKVLESSSTMAGTPPFIEQLLNMEGVHAELDRQFNP